MIDQNVGLQLDGSDDDAQDVLPLAVAPLYAAPDDAPSCLWGQFRPLLSQKHLHHLVRHTSPEQKPRLAKSKHSDACFTTTWTPTKAKDPQRRAVAAFLSLTCLVVLLLFVGARRREPATSVPEAPPADLRRAADLFRRAAAHKRVDAESFLEGTRALLPWLDRLGCGLSSMVEVNIIKLERRHVAERTLDATLADERHLGVAGRDDSASVASVWNGRILEFIAAFLDDLLEHNVDLRDASPSSSAKAAYAKTLHRHHSRFVRAAANALLSSIPDAPAFFEGALGWAPDDVNSAMRRDVADVRAALFLFLPKLQALLRHHNLSV